MDRRALLKVFGSAITMQLLGACGGGGGSTPAPVAPPQGSTPPTSQPPSAIVIGAGMAGLKAAVDLVARGFSVTILEARDRIGGRTWTDTRLGAPADMGASWIHGITGNPIFDFVEANGIGTIPWDYEDGPLFDVSGAGSALTSSQIERGENGLSRALDILAGQNPNGSVQEVVNKAAMDGAFAGLNQGQADFIVWNSVESGFARDVSEMSIQALLEGEEVRGEDVVLRDGYVSLVDNLANGLSIRLNEIVSEVDHSGSVVNVTTNSDTFTADYVVVTVPLGVLKSNAIAFTPALPQAKQSAINAMGMGLLNKTYMLFPNAFWGAGTNFTRVSPTKGAFTYFIELPNTASLPILGNLNMAKFALDQEAKPDAQILNETMDALRTMFGANIPDPTDFTVTRWMDDPFARGSYSTLPVGAVPSMRQDLAASVGNKLFFAGEATNADFPSTVHGAFLSGEAAAARVVSVAGA